MFRSKFLSLLALALILSACLSRYREITVLFPSAEGIGKETLVIWNGVPIGQISSVTPTKKGTEVVININNKYVKNMVVSSTFLLTGTVDHPVLEYHVLNPDSPPLKGGEVIQGVTSQIGLLLLN